MASPRPLDRLRAWLPNRARLAPVGSDGWLSLGLAGVVILASAGLSLLFCFWHCTRIALKAPIAPDGDGVIVVLGARPGAGGITTAFKLRLSRAMAPPGGRQIFILGGATGNMACSEAEILFTSPSNPPDASATLRARPSTSSRSAVFACCPSDFARAAT